MMATASELGFCNSACSWTATGLTGSVVADFGGAGAFTGLVTTAIFGVVTTVAVGISSNVPGINGAVVVLAELDLEAGKSGAGASAKRTFRVGLGATTFAATGIFDGAGFAL